MFISIQFYIDDGNKEMAHIVCIDIDLTKSLIFMSPK